MQKKAMHTRCWSAATAPFLLLLLLCLGLEVKGEIFTVLSGDSIQAALDEASAGDTVRIERGNYFEDLVTRNEGTEKARITIEGAGGASDRDNVVLRGTGKKSRVFEVMHDYYTLKDFTIDGQAVDDVDGDNYKEDIREKLLFVTARRAPTERSGGYKSALDGLIVSGMKFQNAGGECIRLRYFVTKAVIDGNEIYNCGLYDYVYNTQGDEKNGEGIYIGTASNQWDDGKNYSDDPDECFANVISNNEIKTHGNEGVDVKAGCLDTEITDNNISMQKDPKSGGISSNGDRTIIENNYIQDAAGAGVRIGGREIDGRQYGVDNQVIGNTLKNCEEYGIKIESGPQSSICGNTIELPSGADEDDYRYSGGNYGENYRPMIVCLGDDQPGVTPSPTSSPDATPSPTSSPDVTPSPTISPGVTPGPTSSPDATPGPTSYPDVTAGPTPSPDDTPSPSPSSDVTPSPTPSPEVTPGPTSSSPDAVYFGCFKDVPGQRTMGYEYKDKTNLTNEACIARCRESNQMFAGTYKGKSCRCSMVDWRVDRHGASTDCTVPCPGEPSTICGGDWAVTSWELIY